MRGERDFLDSAISQPPGTEQLHHPISGRFQAAHRILKEGGNGIPAIMVPERQDTAFLPEASKGCVQDLLSQWQRVDSAWKDFISYQPVTTDDLSRLEASLQRALHVGEGLLSLGLVEQLEILVPLYHVVDVSPAC